VGLGTRSPVEGVVLDLLALVSAFCIAGQPKMQNGYCAAGLENLAADEELKEGGREGGRERAEPSRSWG
jgi:hypothetical protein